MPDFDGDLKIHLIPVDRMKMLVRLENLADLFDGAPSQTPMFDLKQYVQNVFSANNSSEVDIKITERTLTDN